MKVTINEVEYEVDFKYKHGTNTTYSPMYGADSGDPAEVQIEAVYLGDKQIEVNDTVREQIEQYIHENYIPDDDDYEEFYL